MGCCGQERGTSASGPWWKRVIVGGSKKVFSSEANAVEWLRRIGEKSIEDCSPEEVLVWRELQRQKKADEGAS